MREAQLLFESQELTLFGMICEPDLTQEQDLRKGYVICHPFAEEKKSAQKPLVDLARQLQKNGAFVLLFDFSGCGESEGELKSAGLSKWVSQTLDAVSYLREHYPVSETGLIGLRLGAFIAMSAAARLGDLDTVTLIEPVIQPEKYLRSELRSKLMKELITNGKVAKSRNELIEEVKSAQSIDFDGHEISPAFYEDMAAQPALTEIIGAASEHLSIFLIHVSPTGKTSRQFSLLLQNITTQKRPVKDDTVIFESFWYRTGPLSPTPFVDSVTALLETQKTPIAQ